MRKRLYLCRLGRLLPKEFKNEHIISWIFLRGDFELLDVPFVLLFKKHHACFFVCWGCLLPLCRHFCSFNWDISSIDAAQKAAINWVLSCSRGKGSRPAVVLYRQTIFKSESS